MELQVFYFDKMLSHLQIRGVFLQKAASKYFPFAGASVLLQRRQTYCGKPYMPDTVFGSLVTAKMQLLAVLACTIPVHCTEGTERKGYRVL